MRRDAAQLWDLSPQSKVKTQDQARRTKRASSPSEPDQPQKKSWAKGTHEKSAATPVTSNPEPGSGLVQGKILPVLTLNEVEGSKELG